MLTRPPQQMALAAARISDRRNHLTEASARLSQPAQQKLSRVAMKGSNIDYIVVVPGHEPQFEQKGWPPGPWMPVVDMSDDEPFSGRSHHITTGQSRIRPKVLKWPTWQHPSAHTAAPQPATRVNRLYAARSA